MTPEAQRIAIAKACGWTQITNSNTMAIGGIWRGYPPRNQIVGKKDLLPDYLNDLNAMHEAEKVLTMKQVEIYLDLLFARGRAPVYEEYQRVHATAEQRAEAFLRTLNLWARRLITAKLAR